MKKIVPFRAIPCRPPNKLVRMYELPFTDRASNTAMITYADYLDKNKNLVEGYTMYIKWDNL